MRQLLVALVVAACVLHAAAAPAQIGSNGALVVDADKAALYANILTGIDRWSYYASAGQEMPVMVASAAAEPPAGNYSAKDVATAFADVVSAAWTQSEVLSTLGNPSYFKYGSVLRGDKRVALYRMPPKGKPKGTCIFIHGCKHDPYSFFYKSSGCPLCTGLPEEVSHSKQCLARGYAVLALMSKDRQYRSRCFSSSGNPELSDQADAGAIVKAWTKRFKMDKKPKYMFGISSGAAFAIKFPGTMYIDGVVSEVNMPWPEAWGAVDLKTYKLKYKFPPTAYYMMTNDPQTEAQIKKAVHILKDVNNVPADYIFIPQTPVTKSFLTNRSIFISPAQSAQIQKALLKIGVIDSNGFVQYDVRFNRKWTTQLPKILPWLKRSSPYYNLISDESQIWQELNLAYARHEIISDFVRPTLMWLESKGKQDLNALVDEYSLQGKISCLTEDKEGC